MSIKRFGSMSNIKQRFINVIILFTCLFLCGCHTTQEQKELIHKSITTPPQLEIAVLMPKTGPNGALGREYDSLIKWELRMGSKLLFILLLMM